MRLTFWKDTKYFSDNLQGIIFVFIFVDMKGKYEKIEVTEGVVAEYNGGFWGIEHTDEHCTSKNFVDFEKAEIKNPKYCTKPTDMTWNPQNTNGYNHEYDMLKKARLVYVKKTITTEFEILT